MRREPAGRGPAYSVAQGQLGLVGATREPGLGRYRVIWLQ